MSFEEIERKIQEQLDKGISYMDKLLDGKYSYIVPNSEEDLSLPTAEEVKQMRAGTLSRDTPGYLLGFNEKFLGPQKEGEPDEEYVKKSQENSLDSIFTKKEYDLYCDYVKDYSLKIKNILFKINTLNDDIVDSLEKNIFSSDEFKLGLIDKESFEEIKNCLTRRNIFRSSDRGFDPIERLISSISSKAHSVVQDISPSSFGFSYNLNKNVNRSYQRKESFYDKLKKTFERIYVDERSGFSEDEDSSYEKIISEIPNSAEESFQKNELFSIDELKEQITVVKNYQSSIHDEELKKANVSAFDDITQSHVSKDQRWPYREAIGPCSDTIFSFYFPIFINASLFRVYDYIKNTKVMKVSFSRENINNAIKNNREESLDYCVKNELEIGEKSKDLNIAIHIDKDFLEEYEGKDAVVSKRLGSFLNTIFSVTLSQDKNGKVGFASNWSDKNSFDLSYSGSWVESRKRERSFSEKFQQSLFAMLYGETDQSLVKELYKKINEIFYKKIKVKLDNFNSKIPGGYTNVSLNPESIILDESGKIRPDFIKKSLLKNSSPSPMVMLTRERLGFTKDPTKFFEGSKSSEIWVRNTYLNNLNLIRIFKYYFSIELKKSILEKINLGKIEDIKFLDEIRKIDNILSNKISEITDFESLSKFLHPLSNSEKAKEYSESGMASNLDIEKDYVWKSGNIFDKFLDKIRYISENQIESIIVMSRKESLERSIDEYFKSKEIKDLKYKYVGVNSADIENSSSENSKSQSYYQKYYDDYIQSSHSSIFLKDDSSFQQYKLEFFKSRENFYLTSGFKNLKDFSSKNIAEEISSSPLSFSPSEIEKIFERKGIDLPKRGASRFGDLLREELERSSVYKKFSVDKIKKMFSIKQNENEDNSWFFKTLLEDYYKLDDYVFSFGLFARSVARRYDKDIAIYKNKPTLLYIDLDKYFSKKLGDFYDKKVYLIASELINKIIDEHFKSGRYPDSGRSMFLDGKYVFFGNYSSFDRCKQDYPEDKVVEYSSILDDMSEVSKVTYYEDNPEGRFFIGIRPISDQYKVTNRGPNLYYYPKNTSDSVDNFINNSFSSGLSDLAKSSVLKESFDIDEYLKTEEAKEHLKEANMCKSDQEKYSSSSSTHLDYSFLNFTNCSIFVKNIEDQNLKSEIYENVKQFNKNFGLLVKDFIMAEERLLGEKRDRKTIYHYLKDSNYKKLYSRMSIESSDKFSAASHIRVREDNFFSNICTSADIIRKFSDIDFFSFLYLFVLNNYNSYSTKEKIAKFLIDFLDSEEKFVGYDSSKFSETLLEFHNSNRELHDVLISSLSKMSGSPTEKIKKLISISKIHHNSIPISVLRNMFGLNTLIKKETSYEDVQFFKKSDYLDKIDLSIVREIFETYFLIKKQMYSDDKKYEFLNVLKDILSSESSVFRQYLTKDSILSIVYMQDFSKILESISSEKNISFDQAEEDEFEKLVESNREDEFSKILDKFTSLDKFMNYCKVDFKNLKSENNTSILKALKTINVLVGISSQIGNFKSYYSLAKKKKEELFSLNFNFSISEKPTSRFSFEVLKDLDPYHFQVGADTNCCQAIGSAGEAAAIDSFVNPYAGVILLKLDGVLVSQSYFHWLEKENYIILDNVEYSWLGHNLGHSIVQRCYAALGKFALSKGFEKVLCGISFTPFAESDSVRFDQNSEDHTPRHIEWDEKYTDYSKFDSLNITKPSISNDYTLLDKNGNALVGNKKDDPEDYSKNRFDNLSYTKALYSEMDRVLTRINQYGVELKDINSNIENIENIIKNYENKRSRKNICKKYKKYNINCSNIIEFFKSNYQNNLKILLEKKNSALNLYNESVKLKKELSISNDLFDAKPESIIYLIKSLDDKVLQSETEILSLENNRKVLIENMEKMEDRRSKEENLTERHLRKWEKWFESQKKQIDSVDKLILGSKDNLEFYTSESNTLKEIVSSEKIKNSIILNLENKLNEKLDELRSEKIDIENKEEEVESLREKIEKHLEDGGRRSDFRGVIRSKKMEIYDKKQDYLEKKEEYDKLQSEVSRIMNYLSRLEKRSFSSASRLKKTSVVNNENVSIIKLSQWLNLNFGSKHLKSINSLIFG